MWLTKDEPYTGFPNGRIKLHINKPYKLCGVWDSEDNSITCDPYMYLSEEFNMKELTYDEPLEVELTIRRPFKFKLSEETESLLEKETGKSIEELQGTPLNLKTKDYVVGSKK